MSLLLIKQGAWLEKTDGYGKSAIHYAKSGIMKILLLGRTADRYHQAWWSFIAYLEGFVSLVPDLMFEILDKLHFFLP